MVSIKSVWSVSTIGSGIARVVTLLCLLVSIGGGLHQQGIVLVESGLPTLGVTLLWGMVAVCGVGLLVSLIAFRSLVKTEMGGLGSLRNITYFMFTCMVVWFIGLFAIPQYVEFTYLGEVAFLFVWAGGLNWFEMTVDD